MYNKLVNAIMAQPKLYSTHKITYKEGLEVHTFGNPKNTELEEAKKLFKEKGYKSVDVHNQAQELAYRGKLCNSYLTILYGAEKDKISISLFDIGYGHAFYKQRYYPIKKNTPIFAWTKHMYSLLPLRKSKKSVVRIQTGNVQLYGSFPEIGDVITKTLYNINYNPNVMVSYRHILNTKNDWEALENYVGRSVPESLKRFDFNSIIMLCKTLKDINDLDKFGNYCEIYNEPRPLNNLFDEGSTMISSSLQDMLSLMVFGKYDESYLISNHMSYSITLKKKLITLAPSSVDVWNQEMTNMEEILRIKSFKQ